MKIDTKNENSENIKIKLITIIKKDEYSWLYFIKDCSILTEGTSDKL